MPQLEPEDIVGSRFRVIALAGKGGMARVYRAHDTKTSREAAVKILLAEESDQAERFGREADVLARLSHPGIVGYLARGTDPHGRPFVAMPWIEGETLGARLKKRGPLPFEEVKRIGAAIADALAAAHAAGVVHRDIKPSNVMLEPDDGVVLVDFGVARLVDLSSELTHTNMFVGTPTYIAPEQARGDPDVGPAADLYSLGCVLHACLTGRSPFRGDNLVAVLAKVLLQPAPSPREDRPDIPPDLEALVMALLEKQPDERPSDARRVAQALRKASGTPISLVPGSAGISLAEARMCSMVLVGSKTPHPATTALARRYGAAFERLANGTLALRWIEGGGAIERAVAAARCAIGLRAIVPDAPIALATVRQGIDAEEAISGAIDRAALLLDAGQRGVRIDGTTAHLLGARFDVRADVLVSERNTDDDPRAVLGVTMPCLGRDVEIAMLDAMLAQVEDDGAPRAVLVVAEAGAGKTRLRQEWLRRQRARERPPHVWMGRGDPLGAVSGYGLLAQVLRRAMGIRDDEAPEVRQARVHWAVGEALQEGSPQAENAVTFLSELVGAGLSDDDRPALAAARRDRALMGEQLRSALVDFVRGTARERPLVIALEDPQPGDEGSLRLLDAALAEDDGTPVLFAAFVRPSYASALDPWHERRVQRLALEPLSKKSSERLVRTALGKASDDAVQRIVSLASGNPFYLEELVRAHAAGDGLPDSMLAVIESRFDDLSPEDRRVLRAASVFGTTFCAAAVEHVLRGGDAAAGLSRLQKREIIGEHRASRYADQEEFAFRHALVRDAAYATLTEDDRRRGHAAAAEWLEASGEPDPGLLGWHLELGGESERAAEHYGRVVSQMIDAGSFAQAIETAERALWLTAIPATRAWFAFAISEAAFWSGDNERCARAAEEGMSAREAREVYGLCLARRVQMSTRVGNAPAAELFELAVEFVREAPDADGSARVAATVGTSAILSGRRDIAERMIELVSVERADIADQALLYQMLAFFELDDLELRSEYFEKSASACEASGRTRGMLLQRINAAAVHGLIGRFDAAESVLRDLEGQAEESGVRFLQTAARQELGQVLARCGRFAEARDFCRSAADAFREQANLGAESVARASLARALLGLGETEAALEHARRAVEIATTRTDARAIANAAFAEVALAAGSIRDALEAARAAMDAWTEGGVSSGWESTIRLAHLRALDAAKLDGEWRTHLHEARASIERRSARMRDAAARRAFLEQPDNATILAL